MINMTSLITFSIYIVSLSAMLILLLVQIRKRNQLAKTVIQLALDKTVLLDKIDKIMLENSDEANEGFIKFLSQSRDAAFEYIDDVQSTIKNYLVALNGTDPIVALEARKKLSELLPDSTNN